MDGCLIKGGKLDQTSKNELKYPPKRNKRRICSRVNSGDISLVIENQFALEPVSVFKTFLGDFMPLVYRTAEDLIGNGEREWGNDIQAKACRPMHGTNLFQI